MARELGLPILPITITGTRFVLPPRTLKPLPGAISLLVHPPIDIAQYEPDQMDRLMRDVGDAVASGLPGRAD